MDLSVFGVIIGAIIGATASVVTTWINRRYSLEERERDIELRREEQELAFVRTITPRCLDALQAANKNSMRILTLLSKLPMNNIASSPQGFVTFDDQPFHRELDQIRAWYDDNCVFLPLSIKRDFIGAINMSDAYIDDLKAGRNTPEVRNAWDKLNTLIGKINKEIESFMERFSPFARLQEFVTSALKEKS
jgi:hypothetical protein